MARHGLDSISNTADVIDSRDVIARIDYLTDLRDSAKDAAEELKQQIKELEDTADRTEEQDEELSDLRDQLTACTETTEKGQEFYTSDEYTEEEHRELTALEELADEASGYAADWQYGEALIRDDYFEDYASEMASDLYGKEISDAKWPFDCIDWEQAARELQQDYTSVDFDGVTYWIR